MNGNPNCEPDYAHQQSSYDFQVDYTGLYSLHLACGSNPPYLQNMQSGVAKTLESPNTNNQPPNSTRVSGHWLMNSSKISVVNSGSSNIKVFYQSNASLTNRCYLASLQSNGGWTDELVAHGYPMIGHNAQNYDYGEITGSLTAASDELVYLQGNVGNGPGTYLKYFQKVGSNWNVNFAFANHTPISNCAGNILLDQQQRV